MLLEKIKYLAFTTLLWGLCASFCLPQAMGKNKRKKEKELDISGLAEEYWRPQKDRLGVIQNKIFTKKNRFAMSLLYGFLDSSQYTSSSSLSIALGFNITERLSLELSYTDITNKPSKFLKAVNERFGFTPDFNYEQNRTMGMLTFTPIYGKFALFGQQISHFEFYFGLGGGVTKTTKQHPTLGLLFGNHFFINKHLLLRTEWRMVRFTDEITITQGSGSIANGGSGTAKESIVRRNLMLGLGVLF